ncbi:MAG TPA: molybdopterin-dependent oxidoreductase [Halobacteriales archaeon]|nr:molybdopterin-dependent oxidoreductase [Halobacteriales archaeon]
MDSDVTRTVRDRLREVGPTVAVAAVAGAAGTLGSYALAGFTPGFVAAPIAGFLARTLPGFVLTAAILLLGSLGQQLNLLTAIGIATLSFALAAAAGIFVGRREGGPLLGAAIAGVVAGGIALVLTGSPIPALGTAVAVALVVGAAEVGGTAAPAEAPEMDDRRRVLKAVAGLVGVSVLGLGARQAGVGVSTGGARDRAQLHPGGELLPDGEAIDSLLAEADEKSLAIGGIEPLVSQEFYEVDIAAVNPDLSAEDWSLSFTGAVAEERSIDYETLTSMEAEHRFVTLRCVGENLNAHKIDNALWTGVPIAPLLDELEIDSDCGCVMLRAADDYYEEFPLEALRTGFLAWGMNGRELPRAHGYPVRALIPGHWGEINVKWLTEVEFLEREVDGYWEERGWHGTGPVNTVAKLHAVNRLGDTIQVGGHAYAGVRDIERVEVSTDGGDTWNDATLSEPLPGEDVWRMWAYEYQTPGESHEVVVRAVDGTGATQEMVPASPFPNGPAGWVRQTVEG